jgi:hypothetical protein
MPIDSATHDSVVALIRETYARISTPGSDAGSLFNDVDIAIAGSGQGELVAGPEMAGRMANGVAGLGFRWTADTITVWRRGDVAWAQILGTVEVTKAGATETVPYWTTGVFGRDGDGWRWLYWGGSEPQESPRV